MSTQSPEKQKVVKIQRWQIGLNVLIQAALVGIIVLAVNALSFAHFKRWDFSRDKQYELSSQTKNILANLQKPVAAITFFSGAAEVLPDLSNLLREYEFAGHKKFTVEQVDPYQNLARAEALKTKYKIQETDNCVILDYDGKSKFVNASDMVDMNTDDEMAQMMGQPPKIKDFKGEAAITSALLELTAGKPNKVYLVAGHGEPDVLGAEGRYFSEALKRQNIQTAALNLLNAGKIPDDARSLLICGPKYDLSELEIKLLNEFWEKKGSLFICLNPYAKTPRLNAWLTAQGITPQDDRVIGEANFMSQDENGLPKFTKGVTENAFFTIPQNSNSPITKDLAGVGKQLLGATQSLLLEQGRSQELHVRLTSLIESAEGFWGETDLDSDLKKATLATTKGHKGPLTLAASVEKGSLEDPRIKVDTSRMIVVGNAEFLTDNEARASEGANFDFAVNGLNWLLAHEESIGIPPKEKKAVTITLDDKQLKLVALTLMGAIPGFFAFLGVVNWLLRRS